MKNKKSWANGLISRLINVTIILAVLQVFGVIDWSGWLIFAPIYGFIAVVFGAVFALWVVETIMTKFLGR